MGVDGFLAEASSWARERPDVRALLVVGSQARTEAPADEFSDVDLVVIVDEPAPYVESAGWLEPFGDALLTFVEPTAVGPLLERRVLFGSGLEVDFSLVPAASMRDLLTEPEIRSVFARGYRVLHDELGLDEDLALAARFEPAPVNQTELARLSSDFWYHVLWAAKKLRRGETFVAKQACDCYLKSLLVDLLAATVRARDPEADTWHRARFLERWAPPAELNELRATYARYDVADVGRAIRATAELFKRLELELGNHVEHDELVRRLDALLALS